MTRYIREMIGRLMPSGMYVRPRLEVKIPEITTNKIMDVVIFPLMSQFLLIGQILFKPKAMFRLLVFSLARSLGGSGTG